MSSFWASLRHFFSAATTSTAQWSSTRRRPFLPVAAHARRINCTPVCHSALPPHLLRRHPHRPCPPCPLTLLLSERASTLAGLWRPLTRTRTSILPTRHQPRLLILVRNSGMHAFLTAVRSAPAMRLHPWIRTAKSPERPTCCLSPHHNHIHFPAQAAPLPEYTFGVLIAWCRSSRLPESSSGTHRGLVHPHHSRTASSACGRCQPLCRRATVAPPQPRRRSRA